MIHTSVLKRVDFGENISERGLPLPAYKHQLFKYIYFLGFVTSKPLEITVNRFQFVKYFSNRSPFFRYVLLAGLISSCAVAIPVSVPGLILRLFANQFRNVFGYSLPRKILSHQDENRDKDNLKLMSWNVGLGPGYMSYDNRLNLPYKRIGAIIDQIVRQRPDVLALQEVLDPESRDMLVGRLSSLDYHCVHSVLAAGVCLSGGLLLAVRGHENKVRNVGVWKFTNLVNYDFWSNKGLLKMELTIQHKILGEKKVTLFNTHLQSDYEGKLNYSKIRTEQISAIMQEIGESQAANVVLLADLNFSCYPLRNQQPPSSVEYAQSMKIIEGSGLLKNPNHEAQNSGNGSFYNFKGGTIERSRAVIDYILISPHLAQEGRTSEIIPLEGKTSLEFASDHTPITHEFSLASLR